MKTITRLFSAVVAIIATWAITDSAECQFQTPDNDEVKVTARYHIQKGSDTGYLIVKLIIPAGNHIYSMTQTKPLLPSKLSVKPSNQFSVGKKFKSDKKPKVIEKDPVFQSRLEKHTGTVQFYVPMRMASGVNPESVKPEITFSGQMCSDKGFCMPINGTTVKAKFAGFFEREAKNSVPPLRQKK